MLRSSTRRPVRMAKIEPVPARPGHVDPGIRLAGRLAWRALVRRGTAGGGPLPDVGLHSAELELAADPLNLLAGSPAK
jgi:hypothetical protein